MMDKLVIRDWSEADRPRERLLDLGRRALSNAELLAIIIGSGSRQETAVSLCRRLLLDHENNLDTLSKLEVVDLCRYKGIGDAKAISIIAALELGRRRNEEVQVDKPILNNSFKVFDYFKHQFQDLPHEEFWVIYLNTASKVLDKRLIGRGGTDFTPVDVRVVLRYALQLKAKTMLLLHNHPSGTLRASTADIELTRKIVDSAEIMDISVSDHVIFTDTGYYSFRDDGLL